MYVNKRTHQEKSGNPNIYLEIDTGKYGKKQKINRCQSPNVCERLYN
jgi:hypothetical protein